MRYRIYNPIEGGAQELMPLEAYDVDLNNLELHFIIADWFKLFRNDQEKIKEMKEACNS